MASRLPGLVAAALLQFGIAAGITLVCAWLGALSIGMLFLPSLVLLMFAFARG